MRKATSKLTTAAGIALVALMSTFTFSGATSAAEGIRNNNGVTVITPNRGVNRGNVLRHRNAGENRGLGINNYGSRHRNFNENRNYGNESYGSRHHNFSENRYYGNDNYGGHHRRHRGIGFGGISIELGSIDSGCRYSYRKWQNTGSRYWRSRYYDCVG